MVGGDRIRRDDKIWREDKIRRDDRPFLAADLGVIPMENIYDRISMPSKYDHNHITPYPVISGESTLAQLQGAGKGEQLHMMMSYKLAAI